MAARAGVEASGALHDQLRQHGRERSAPIMIAWPASVITLSLHACACMHTGMCIALTYTICMGHIADWGSQHLISFASGKSYAFQVQYTTIDCTRCK